MICVAALIVFSLLALFSAKYRPLAKEAFSCVFLKLRLRPCQSGLDKRVRTSAMMPFVKRAPRVARFIYKAFPILSWLFVLLTVASFAYSAYAGYNYLLYGNCNGPGSSGFCVFDPAGAESSGTGECTPYEQVPESLLKPTEANLTGMKTYHPNGSLTVIFFGCYSCPYTREAAPALLQAINDYPDVRFVLIDFPISRHEGSMAAANAGNCVYDADPAQYLTYAATLYSAQLNQTLPDTGLTCNAETHQRVTQGLALGKQARVYGTPTYFIGEDAYVGPLNKRSLYKLINEHQD